MKYDVDSYRAVIIGKRFNSSEKPVWPMQSDNTVSGLINMRQLRSTYNYSDKEGSQARHDPVEIAPPGCFSM